LLDALMGRWFTPGFAARRPELARLVAGMLGTVDAEGYAGCCEAIGAMDQRDSLASIGAPTLIVAGAADPVVPPPVALAMQEGITGSSLVVLSGAAHLANIEQPERFTAAVFDHLAGPPVERGRRVRREVLGDAHVDRSEAAATSFTAPFLDLITRHAWGDIWTRPGLDRATRSCITLAMLVALGRFEELPLHVRGARRNGLSPDQIGEVLLQSAVYCGVPAANSAFAVAQRILSEDADG
jgi:3-oxoadipate enol-lactonase/4-carboxymuconolactone decarboxylase